MLKELSTLVKTLEVPNELPWFSTTAEVYKDSEGREFLYIEVEDWTTARKYTQVLGTSLFYPDKLQVVAEILVDDMLKLIKMNTEVQKDRVAKAFNSFLRTIEGTKYELLKPSK